MKANRLCLFPGTENHPARFDAIGFAIEASIRLNAAEADTLQETGHFGKRVQPDVVAYRIVAFSGGPHDDKAYPHATRCEIECPMLDI